MILPVLQITLALISSVLGIAIPGPIGNALSLIIFIIMCGFILNDIMVKRRKPTILEIVMFILLAMRIILMIFVWWL